MMATELDMNRVIDHYFRTCNALRCKTGDINIRHIASVAVKRQRTQRAREFVISVWAWCMIVGVSTTHSSSARTDDPIVQFLDHLIVGIFGVCVLPALIAIPTQIYDTIIEWRYPAPSISLQGEFNRKRFGGFQVVVRFANRSAIVESGLRKCDADLLRDCIVDRLSGESNGGELGARA